MPAGGGMSTEQLLAIAIGLVSFFGGLWVRTIQSDLKDLGKSQSNYVLREDLHRELSGITNHLTRIEQKVDSFVQRIDERLEKKADRP